MLEAEYYALSELMNGPIGINTASGLRVPTNALLWSFTIASGPGGQNVNKTSSKVTLTVATASIYGDAVTVMRVREKFGEKISITCQESRSQMKNRKTCIDKMNKIIEKASKPVIIRKKTSPSKASVNKKKVAKTKASEKKQARRPIR